VEAARLQELVPAGLAPRRQAGQAVSAKATSKGKSSGIPPYDLRHAFASLQIRAGLSIPELAEQMGHSPQITLATYAHVIRELKGLPRVSAETQIEQAREARGRQVDVSVRT
jgi:integrase